MAATGAAVKLKRLRQRFGISAPKLAIRTHVAWYWRAVAIVVLLSISLALAEWVYDAGRSIAGFDSRTSSQALADLKARVVELEAELAVVRGVASAADSNLKIERVAQQQLGLQVRALESENAALKQDLAFFEGILPDSIGGEQGVRINRFRIEPGNLAGQYRYRLLVIHSATRTQKEFRGNLQIVLKVQEGGRDVMITFPSENDTERQRYRLDVKHFQRAEGMLSIPSGTVLKSAEARILQDGVVRARQTINL
jgi:hypothetical protein